MDKFKDKLNTKIQAVMTPTKTPPPVPPRMKSDSAQKPLILPKTPEVGSTEKFSHPPISVAPKPAPPGTAADARRKRTLLWDWTSVRDDIPIPDIPKISPIVSCHNWNTWAPPALPSHVPFRPMFRTLEQLHAPEFEYALSQPYPIMHFLNEPERLEGVTPEVAVNLWFEKIVPLRKERGTKIVGPATASDPNGTAWLDRFMELVEQRDPSQMPNFLGLHYYGPEPQGAIVYLTERHNKYPQIPVNISEVACISRSKEEVERFNREFAAWADAQPWVVEYGFFGMMRECADDFVSPAAQLMDRNGEINAMGKWVLGV